MQSKFIAERTIFFSALKNLPSPLIYWFFFSLESFDPSFCITAGSDLFRGQGIVRPKIVIFGTLYQS